MGRKPAQGQKSLFDLSSEKTCGRCKVTKAISEFYVSKSSGKPHSLCKACQIDASKIYRREKSETVRKARREYYLKNREKRNEESRQYAAKNKETLREYRKEYHRKHAAEISLKNKQKRAQSPIPYDREQRRKSHLKCTFGLTTGDYDNLLESQNGVCAICGKKTKTKLHVDHCHVTGIVRGLLCQRCNAGLGLFCDEPSLMMRAIEYVTSKANGHA